MAPDELPRQRKGVTPQMRGRYPDFNVLDEVGHWDEATRKVVLDRIEHVPTIRFFTTDEVATLGPSSICSWPRTTSRGSRC